MNWEGKLYTHKKLKYIERNERKTDKERKRDRGIQGKRGRKR